ncbi:MAG: sirohydrochlorin chelatase [Corynebacterium flavescens]|uniref:sirohydrochlorin chelatase n=1 Tax=Corynebacterium flavescens TaxID=28028 RepID=UPI002647A682|nr:sirohydrochlorin chelatase [Corynebacterium flavescens]MDN6600836.1 sirohydrochlorin chelatase [Corynebacterium flavescens]
MTALITLSHGSRHPGAAAGVDRLTRAAARDVGINYFLSAHLEFTEPNLAGAANSLASLGVEEAVVVPLLFTSGYHQRVDVPNAVSVAEDSSGLRLKLTPGLGTGEEMARVLARRMLKAHPDEHCILYAVGSSDPCANIAVEKLATRVADLTGHSTSVAFATRGGREAIAAQATGYRHVRVLPLFVTAGLLLDLLSDSPGHIDPPLGEDLAEIVAARFQVGARTHARQLLKNGI